VAADRVTETTSLLVRTSKAHGVYEENELSGVYDQAWSEWYAQYAVDNGIGPLVGHPVTADQLAQFLASSNVDFERDKPGDSWAAYTARRIIQEL